MVMTVENKVSVKLFKYLCQVLGGGTLNNGDKISSGGSETVMDKGRLDPFKLKLKFIGPLGHYGMQLRGKVCARPDLMSHLPITHPFGLRLRQPVYKPGVMVAHDA